MLRREKCLSLCQHVSKKAHVKTCLHKPVCQKKVDKHACVMCCVNTRQQNMFATSREPWEVYQNLADSTRPGQTSSKQDAWTVIDGPLPPHNKTHIMDIACCITEQVASLWLSLYPFLSLPVGCKQLQGYVSSKSALDLKPSQSTRPEEAVLLEFLITLHSLLETHANSG